MKWDERLAECEGFQWDAGNSARIWGRHQVMPTECEELFFNRPVIVGSDEQHSSSSEERFYALGQSDSGRLMFVVLAIRGRLIRVISARDMSRRERRIQVVMKKALPKFKSEDSEREFWAQHDSADFIDWRKGKRVTLPNLRPSSQTISLRLPKPMLDRLKLLANKRDVPYQSLLKMFVAERLKAEFES